MTIGQRVRVHIEYAGQYASGLAEKLDGAMGVVEDYNPRSTNGRRWLSPAALVAFDRPVASQIAGSMHTHFWFPIEDLREEP